MRKGKTGSVKYCILTLIENATNRLGKSILKALYYECKFIKRWFNIETPFYKFMWKEYKVWIQAKLNAEHNTNY